MLSHPPAIKSSLRIREGFSEELVCVVEGLRTTKQPELVMTGKPGVLQSMGPQKVEPDLVTAKQQQGG